MKSKRAFQFALIGILGIFLFSTVWAAGDGRTFVLESTPAHPDANGTAVIDREHVSIQARGLEPNAIYTVWFVNMKPSKHETGAGSAPYMFRTNSWGDGNYSAPLKGAPFDKWAMVMVVLHPDGNPKNMKNMVGALKASI